MTSSNGYYGNVKTLTIWKTCRDDRLSSYVISVQNKRYFHDDSFLNSLRKGGPRPRAPRTKHGQYRAPARGPS